MENRAMSYTSFSKRSSDYPTSGAQSNHKRSSSRALRELVQTNDRRSSRSEVSRSKQSYEAAGDLNYKKLSSRILNSDGSVPMTTDELVARGFEILIEERKKLRRENGVSNIGNESSNRIISDSSSRSSATYVCSPTTASPERPNVLLPRLSPNTPPTSSTRPSGVWEVPADIPDTQNRLRTSLDKHEDKIRAMQAEIAALKRAAILSRELRHEAALEQTTKLGERLEIGKKRREGRNPERRPIVQEALMSGANGTGEDYAIPMSHTRSFTGRHIYAQSTEGMPTPPQSLRCDHREKQQRYPETGRRTDEMKKPVEKLCLRRDCIPRTRRLINDLAANYNDETSTLYTKAKLRCIKPPLIDPRSQAKRHSKPGISSVHAESRSLSRRCAPDVQALRRGKGKENSRTHSHEVDYMQKLKEISETPCGCYDCKFKENRAEFERKHAIFPPIDNDGVWAMGEDADGWYW